jgi:hypothetical protein
LSKLAVVVFFTWFFELRFAMVVCLCSFS